VSGDEPGVVPGLDGSGGDAELCGDLVQGEHAGVAESLFAAGQLVVVADVADDEPVEGAAFAAGQAVGAPLRALQNVIAGTVHPQLPTFGCAFPVMHDEARQ
jgi:hypothetical protein